ncbi:MAG: hypothetical protein KJS92_02070 [Bacteroidetes bacterium]|nr:hypothetical protein [Bacteroidota bacterium]
MNLFSKTLMLFTTGTALLISCKQNGQESGKATTEQKVFENARKVGDRGTCITALHRIAVLDSSATWVSDSLAYYYYFYTQNPKAAGHYVDISLKLKPDDIGMNELKAKVDIQQQKDSAGIARFEKLWNRTKDYTYLYNIAATHILTGRVVKADSIVVSLLKLNPIPAGNVRIEVAEANSQQQIPVEAAFTYLKSYLVLMNGERALAMKMIERCLELKPDFMLAQDMKMNMTRQSNPGGY